jgi:hypothetical protein
MTYNRISIDIIKEKLKKYDVFLTNNLEELEKKHGVILNRPPIIDSLYK